ncbi:hypothetical protein C8R44DRAFT_750332 [Mycena epipterygia]|nr:hypothetical protein C8R44DRAFT_750332 [Mycena epipterygia]
MSAIRKAVSIFRCKPTVMANTDKTQELEDIQKPQGTDNETLKALEASTQHTMLKPIIYLHQMFPAIPTEAHRDIHNDGAPGKRGPTQYKAWRDRLRHRIHAQKADQGGEDDRGKLTCRRRSKESHMTQMANPWDNISLRLIKIDHRDPAHFHPAMRWDSSMGPRIPDPVEYNEWRPSIPVSRKRKNVVLPGTYASNGDETPEAKHLWKLESNDIEITGLIWDSQDYSCGYDTFFTILGNFLVSEILRLAFESARNTTRWALHVGDPIAFPYGYNPTMIDRIAHKVLPSKYYAVGRLVRQVHGDWQTKVQTLRISWCPKQDEDDDPYKGRTNCYVL